MGEIRLLSRLLELKHSEVRLKSSGVRPESVVDVVHNESVVSECSVVLLESWDLHKAFRNEVLANSLNSHSVL
jgi:hypothetical protein